MRLTQLEVFCTIYKHRSISRASEDLFVSQPAISAHLRQLEEELGVKLFEKIGRNIRPTPSGDILYKYAFDMLKLKSEAESNIEQYRLGLSGQIVLGMATGIVYCIPGLFSSYQHSLSNVKLVLQTAIADNVRKATVEGDVDLGIVWGPVADNRLVSLELTHHEYVMVVSANHPLAMENEINPEELGQLPIIFPPPETSTRKYLEGVLRNLGIAPNIAFELPTTDAMKWAATAGLGIAFLSLPSVELEIKCGILKVLKFQGKRLNRPISIIYKNQPNQTAVMSNFLAYIANHTYWDSKEIHPQNE